MPKIGVREWKNVTTRPGHLTIEDVREIPVGEVRYFVCLDRNLGDFLDHLQWDDEEREWEPRTIRFRVNSWPGYTLAFKKTGEGIEGKVQVLCPGEEFKEEEAGHEWHINYDDESWYPLTVGGERLPKVDPQGFANFGSERRHYQDFPEKTRLGWRGPVIPIEKLGDFELLS